MYCVACKEQIIFPRSQRNTKLRRLIPIGVFLWVFPHGKLIMEIQGVEKNTP
jgi:hypothetical protein